ncbi:MAG: response regulator transcription factor [Actinomycetota bacterium]
MIRVLLVDDQPLIRAGLRGILELEDDLEVVGEASSGRQALQQARDLPVDVILMDIRMPGMDGIEATAQICANPALAHLNVLVLTTFETDEHVMAALRAGASGFLGKGAQPEAVIAAIRLVARGDALLSPAATRSLIERVLREPRAGQAELQERLQVTVDELTEREREILVLVGEGLSNDDIAERLAISRHTVKTHVNRAMTKLGAHDRAQLVVIAYESGLLRSR